MDTETSVPIEGGVAGDGSYLRRAEALLAARAELFLAGTARSVRLAANPGPPQDPARSLLSRRSRQLTLPLPRERTRRRARMVR
jgi:hypothetical protein